MHPRKEPWVKFSRGAPGKMQKAHPLANVKHLMKCDHSDKLLASCSGQSGDFCNFDNFPSRGCPGKPFLGSVAKEVTMVLAMMSIWYCGNESIDISARRGYPGLLVIDIVKALW